MSATPHACTVRRSATWDSLLRGVHALDMSYCTALPITEASFAHQEGIRTLNMSLCCLLPSVHERDMTERSQPTITDASFTHLEGICKLSMAGCKQHTITDAAIHPRSELSSRS